MKNRTVLIHYHIFKNAGTTIDWILKKKFKDKMIKFDDQENPSRVLSPELILDFLKNHPEVIAISSEQLHEMVPNKYGINLIPIIFIRQPIQRANSIYTYNRYVLDETDPSTPAGYAKLHSYGEFLQWRLEIDPNLFVNYQVRFILDLISDFKSNTIEKYFQDAVEYLKNCPIIGIVDRMNESLVVAEHFLKKDFTQIDLSYVVQNLSRNKESETSNISPQQKEKNDLIIKTLEQKNEFDFKLYKLANEELNNRIKKIDDFQKLLLDFKTRCKSISKIKSILVSIKIPAQEKIVKEYLEELKINAKGDPRTLVDEGKHSEALIVLKEKLKENPKWPEGHYLTAICIQELGRDWNAALEHYNKAQKYGFDPFWVFFRRGFLYSLMGKREEAKKDLREAAKLKPDHVHVSHVLQKLEANLISNI